VASAINVGVETTTDEPLKKAIIASAETQPRAKTQPRVSNRNKRQA